MDLNDFIFRDDAAEPLGASADDDENFAATEESVEFGSPAQLGLAVIGGAVLGLSHLIGHATKHI